LATAIPTFWPPLHTAQAIEEAPSTLVKVPPFLLPRSRQRILLLRHRHPALDSAVPPPSPYPLQALARKCDQSRDTESQTHTEEKASHLSNNNFRSRQQKTTLICFISCGLLLLLCCCLLSESWFFLSEEVEEEEEEEQQQQQLVLKL
jgi:hypothetical protein